jgi:hypothetical protein
MKKHFLLLILSALCSSCDADNIETLCPSPQGIYDLVYYERCYVDMQHTGFLGLTIPTWGEGVDQYPKSGLRIGKITHVVKDQMHHYVAEIFFTTASSSKGVEVSGEVRYYRGLVDNNIHWEDNAWKQTGAKKIGKW